MVYKIIKKGNFNCFSNIGMLHNVFFLISYKNRNIKKIMYYESNSFTVIVKNIAFVSNVIYMIKYSIIILI